MEPDALAPELILWTDPQRATLAGALVRAIRPAARLIGLGGPRGGDTLHLAHEHGLSSHDDLRKLLIDHPARYLLLTCVQEIDPRHLQLAMTQGTTILTLEPPTSGFDQIFPAKAPQGDGRLMHLPAFTLSPAWINAGDVQDLIGQVQLIHFESFGSAVELSLHARLAEAWRVLGRFAPGPMPESIDCSITGPLADLPEDPRGLTGHLAAHARMPQGCAAQVTLSDQINQHHRRLAVIGTQGRLVMTDLTYTLHALDGRLLEQSPTPPPPPPEATPEVLQASETQAQPSAPDSPATPDHEPFIRLAIAQWRRLIDHPDQTPWQPPSTQDQAVNLGCQMAALLSARTGQSESPARMAQLVAPGQFPLGLS